MTQPEAKIITFPAQRIVREIPVGIVKEGINKREREQIDQIHDAILNNAFGEFLDYGFDVKNEKFIKDFSYLSMVLEALVYRNYGLEHDLHPMLEETVKVISEEEFEKMQEAIEATDEDE